MHANTQTKQQSALARATLLALGIAMALGAAPAIAQSTDPAARAQQDLDRMDRDGDGRVSATEHEEAAKEAFDDLDDDNDYRVDEEEMDATDRTLVDQATGLEGVRPLDQNDNGEFSAEERRSRSEQDFNARDADGDGYLDESELRAARERQAMRQPAPVPAKAAQPAPETDATDDMDAQEESDAADDESEEPGADEPAGG